MDSDSILGLLLVGVAVILALILSVPEPPNTATVSTDRVDIAVLPFQIDEDWLESATYPDWNFVPGQIRSRIETALVNQPAISVYSRTELDAILTEQQLAGTGIIDASTAVEIGAVTGVNKLVTGTIYRVDKTTEQTTVCEEWDGSDCVIEKPATRHAIEIAGQAVVLCAETGMIEVARDVFGSDEVVITRGEDYTIDALVSDAAADVASAVAAAIAGAYTRSAQYGLFKEYEEKRGSYVGKDESTSFYQSDGRAYLVVHFTRVDRFDDVFVEWLDSSYQTVAYEEDIVLDEDWRVYSFSVLTAPVGKYYVRLSVEEQVLFEVPFRVKD